MFILRHIGGSNKLKLVVGEIVSLSVLSTLWCVRLRSRLEGEKVHPAMLRLAIVNLPAKKKVQLKVKILRMNL